MCNLCQEKFISENPINNLRLTSGIFKCKHKKYLIYVKSNYKNGVVSWCQGRPNSRLKDIIYFIQNILFTSENAITAQCTGQLEKVHYLVVRHGQNIWGNKWKYIFISVPNFLKMLIRSHKNWNFIKILSIFSRLLCSICQTRNLSLHTITHLEWALPCLG